MTIRQLAYKLRQQNIWNAIKIIANIFIYVFLRTISKEKSTEKLLLKKVGIRCKIDGHKIRYNFELLTFLNNFETQEYLDIILDKKYWTFIDIWSNIWRLSWISIVYAWKEDKTVVLCDPNPYVFNVSKTFYEKEIHKNNHTYFLNHAISNTKTELPFFMVKWDVLNGIGSLDEKNILGGKTEKIIVKSITFTNIIEKMHVANDNVLVKIDVEWHEQNVLQSVIDYLAKNSKISKVDLLVEIWEKNSHEIHNFLKKTWHLKEFKKISINDYFIVLQK